VPAPAPRDLPNSATTVAVAIGQWAVAAAPAKIRTLLGSCVGVVLYDQSTRLGGVAHIVLPTASGVVDHPGKYADTAIPGMIAEFRRLGVAAGSRLRAKLVGGANMFQVASRVHEISGLNIGQRNQEAIEQILTAVAIPVLARDLGGTSGRRLTLDTASGTVTIRIPGGQDYEI
jgi:chemotaxis protein CheD